MIRIRVENPKAHCSSEREHYTALRDVLADGVKSLGRQLLTPLGKGSLPQPMKSSALDVLRQAMYRSQRAGKSTL